MKYNLVWDKLLGFNVFPPEVARRELDFYPSVTNLYGLPLDSRATYTKTDWILWTATMAGSQEEFESFVAPVWKFMNETTDRVPMTDWPFTDKPQRRGFKARSDVGGYFIKLLRTSRKFSPPSAWLPAHLPSPARQSLSSRAWTAAVPMFPLPKAQPSRPSPGAAPTPISCY